MRAHVWASVCLVRAGSARQGHSQGAQAPLLVVAVEAQPLGPRMSTVVPPSTSAGGRCARGAHGEPGGEAPAGISAHRLAAPGLPGGGRGGGPAVRAGGRGRQVHQRPAPHGQAGPHLPGGPQPGPVHPRAGEQDPAGGRQLLHRDQVDAGKLLSPLWGEAPGSRDEGAWGVSWGGAACRRPGLLRRLCPGAGLCAFPCCRFIEEKSSFEYGQVNHALAAAMRTLVKEYLVLVTQLEQLQRQGLLSLQKLWFYIQPAMRSLDILASLATSVDKGECIGGATLSLLHDRSFSYTGDSQAQELCLHLTKAASTPYFEILEKWIYRGIIDDPYSEFMVEEHELRKEKIQEDYNDKYWDQRYTVVQRQIPSFLQKMAGKVLSTGKYLNVVRECGHDVTCPVAKEVVYTLKERAYVEQIEKAFSYASKVLLDFLMGEKELLAHLRSIKRYFLMDQGDFFVHFMDLTEEELKKPVDDITPTRLEALLELALRMSTANTDPFKDDLKIDLMPHDLITQLLRVLAIETQQEKAMVHADPTELTLSGLEAFSFDYVVTWPLSLIINRKALTRYQMLFRHMFYCKHVERQLCSVWISNKAAKRFSLHSAKWFAGAFTLRQRMLNFVQNIQSYMMFEVMEPTWHVLEQNLRSASNIDDVLGHHASFLDNCLKDCMLTNPELLRVFSKLMSVCVMFTNCLQRFTQSMKLDSELGHPALEPGAMLGPPTEAERAEERARKELARKCLAEHVDAPQLASSFEATITKFDKNFSAHLLDLLARLSIYSTSDCEHGMASVISRLDFNGFYTERLERLSAERSQKAAPPVPGPRGPPALVPRVAVTAQ
uniref:Gamma-tubulin complex component n=1 Tax=Sus scrofa TaxID=9823 RepID=A0A8D1BDD7_PIG